VEGENRILVIDMNPRWTDCAACGKPTPMGWGLPVSLLDGTVVPIDSDEEWGGVPACKRCHDRHAIGKTIHLK
jgi:hypothetical protein